MSRNCATIDLLEPRGWNPGDGSAWRWGYIAARIRAYATQHPGGTFNAHDIATTAGVAYQQARKAIRYMHRRGELRLVRSHQPGRYGWAATFEPA